MLIGDDVVGTSWHLWSLCKTYSETKRPLALT